MIKLGETKGADVETMAASLEGITLQESE
jgi:hypothetical protein